MYFLHSIFHLAFHLYPTFHKYPAFHICRSFHFCLGSISVFQSISVLISIFVSVPSLSCCQICQYLSFTATSSCSRWLSSLEQLVFLHKSNHRILYRSHPHASKVSKMFVNILHTVHSHSFQLIIHDLWTLSAKKMINRLFCFTTVPASVVFLEPHFLCPASSWQHFRSDPRH